MTLRLVGTARKSLNHPLPFDSILDRSGRRRLLAHATTMDFVRDQTLAKEGEIHEDLMIVAEGVVKLWKTMPDGRRQIVAFRTEGDVVSMHRSETPWPTTAQAVSGGLVHRITWSALRQLAHEQPALERTLLDMAGDEVAGLQAHLLTLGRKTTEEKLASFLLDICRPGLSQTRISREFRLPMRRCDIADYLGLTTESVSREFSRLKRAKIIAMPRPSRVVLLNQRALEEVAVGAPTPGPVPTAVGTG